MSIEALITGKLHQIAEQRTSKAGKPFVTAKARAATGEGESVFVNVIAFSESACAALLALEAGDAVAIAGTLKPGAWVDREGTARASVDMVAAQVLTLYAVKRKRDKSETSKPDTTSRQKPARSSDLPEDDEWLSGGLTHAE